MEKATLTDNSDSTQKTPYINLPDDKRRPSWNRGVWLEKGLIKI